MRLPINGLATVCAFVACTFTAAAAAALERAAQPDSAFAGLLYATDEINATVWLCPTGDLRAGFLPPAAQLSGVSAPVQLAIDRAGTVYVANAATDSLGDGSVGVYPRGQTSPSKVLTSGLNTSTGVAVDSSGTVYVSNKFAASIAVFPNGATRPATVISANLVGPDGLAVDRSDNLYIADSSAKQVFEVRHGTLTPRPLHLSGLLRPIGVAVDSKRNLYVSNLDGPNSNIVVYAHGATQPSRTIAITYSQAQPSIGEPMMLSIGPGDMLVTSVFISLALVGNEWFGGPGLIAGYAPGQSTKEWSGYGISAADAVFQPKR